MSQQPSITCPLCLMTSYHPEDIAHRYCGNCHLFHDECEFKRRLAERNTALDQGVTIVL